MQESKSDRSGGDRDNQPKRSLPSWMNSKETGGNSAKKKRSDIDTLEEPTTVGKGSGAGASSSGDCSQNNATAFSKLLDGVLFAISGIVNPERGNLRTQATDMGAIYRPDWSPDCTLLVCAFAGTPKFKQVQADNGTIISKEWILECHDKRKLVPIEPYLMHAGKPWRKKQKPKLEAQGRTYVRPPKISTATMKPITDDKNSAVRNVQKQVERSHEKSIQSKARDLDIVQKKFSPSQIRAMAKDDLLQTVSWLESQEEKPDADKINEIAAEGVLTCLQDAIESLQQNLGLSKVAEQWGILPNVVQELVHFENDKSASLTRREIADIAIECKEIYESEFTNMDLSLDKGKKIENEGYDSDDTIEMTEEEIEQACRNLSVSDD